MHRNSLARWPSSYGTSVRCEAAWRMNSSGVEPIGSSPGGFAPDRGVHPCPPSPCMSFLSAAPLIQVLDGRQRIPGTAIVGHPVLPGIRPVCQPGWIIVTRSPRGVTLELAVGSGVALVAIECDWVPLGSADGWATTSRWRMPRAADDPVSPHEKCQPLP